MMSRQSDLSSTTVKATLFSQKRVRELQNGKTQLTASHVNFQPIFREVKPLSLNTVASGRASRSPPRGAMSVDAVVGGPLGSSSEQGEDESADDDNNKLMKDMMMMLNSDNLAEVRREFAKRKKLDVLCNAPLEPNDHHDSHVRSDATPRAPRRRIATGGGVCRRHAC